MFIELLTSKNERISVNVDRLFFFGEAKKGSFIVLDDGTSIELETSYETLLSRINSLLSQLVE